MPTKDYNSGIKKRFMQAIDEIVKENYPDLTVGMIAESLGLNQSNLTRFKKSATNNPTGEQLAMLCDIYEISGDCLLNGKGLMKQAKKKPDPLILIEEALRLLRNKTKSAPKVRQKAEL